METTISPLAKKLKLKSGFRAAVAGAPAGYLEQLAPPADIEVSDTLDGGPFDWIQVFVRTSAELAAITGSDPLPRSQVVSKMWDHIRKNNLQNPQNKREILADDKLKKIFGTDRCSMFDMNKHLSRHLS